MKTGSITLLFITILICGCKNSNQNNKKLQSVNNADQISTVSPKLLYPNDSDTIKVELKNGYGEVLIHKKERQYIYLEFKSDGYKKLHAALLPNDSLANIRFNQIIMPDGVMDGPFGREIDYDLLINGIYKLSIHESLMAGDPWGGDFKVILQLHN